MFDMFSIMNKVKEAQEKMKQVQEELLGETLTAEAGVGLVKVTVNGHRKLVQVEIDPSIMNDKEMMQDLTVAATNKALGDIEEVIKKKMSDSMQGVIPNIPGLDLQSFLGR